MNAIKKINKKDIEDIIALTPMQEGMLYHYLKDQNSDYYFEQLSLTITGEIDFNCFKQAWDFVVDTNEMLRTWFRWEKVKKPVQIILKKYQVQAIFHDFSSRSIDENDKLKLIEEIKDKDRKNRFDLNSVPFRVMLCKIHDYKYEMVVSNHHILYDGWSNGILLKEFFSFYNRLVQNETPLKPQKHKYKEYISWIQNQDVQKQREYWNRYLKGFDTKSELSIKPIKEKNINTTAPGNSQYNVQFLKGAREKLEIFLKSHKITLAGLLYSAWGILLQRYNNSGDVLFGTTVSGRSAGIKGIEDIVGLFINTVPLRVRADSGHEKIKDFLSRVNQGLREREAYENASLVEIKEYGEVAFAGELFDTIFVIENYPLNTMLLETNNLLPFSVDSYSMFETTHYDLTVGITPGEDIEVEFTYNENLFDESVIKGLSRHFMKIAADMVDNPGKELAALEILSEVEKNKILLEFNDTAADYPKENSLHGLFAQQVERNPDNIAVVGKVQSAERHVPCAIHCALTYRELNNQSNRLAHILTGKGVGVDAIVGIMVERSIEMIIGILGILKAGSAYLPIDPNYPVDRIAYLLADSSAKILVTSPALSGKFEKLLIVNCQLLIVNEIPPNRRRLNNPPKEANSINNYQLTINNLQLERSNLAYVIYTSGTTGKPKGVMVEHSAVMNRLFWVRDKYRLNERDVILQATSFVFDVSVCEMFRWIPVGGRLCLLPPGGEKDPGQIVRTIARNGVTTADFIPAMLTLLLDYAHRQNLLKELAGLRWVWTGVEVVNVELVKKFNETLHRLNRTRLINAYGPTESTVDVTYFDCSAFENNNVVPIGRPMANVRVYILAINDTVQPVGVYGQLCIAGKGLARGYLNNPELTVEKFDHDLWDYQDYHDGNHRSNRSYMPYVLYKTGDLARWLPDGNVEFLGRMDFQVKVSGFRIEPGEIENWLMKHPGVKEAVVVPLKDSQGEVRLCAYVVGGAAPDELHRYLSGITPGYMVPAYFEKIDAIPLTASGKVNRSALPSPTIKTPEKYIAPGNEIEKALVNTWAEILKIDKKEIGIHDSFFRLGGHSLKATILAAKIHKVFDVKVPLTELFKRPRISQLAQYIKGMVKDVYVSIEPQEKKEFYLLSSAQKRMYVEQHMQIESKIYNVAAVIILEGETNDKRLTDAFRQLIKRHESLRTSFVTLRGEAVQVIHEDIDFTIEYLQSEEENYQEIAANFWRPFDLSKAPLLRVGLIKRNEIKHIMMVEMHHIISDGISDQILMREFRRLYKGENLLPLRIQYKDFSGWQTRLFESGTIKNQEKYWKKQYMNDIPVLDLSTDYPRPSGPVSNEAHSVTFFIDKELTARINEVLVETGATMFMFLLAVNNILLSKYSGQVDIVVGCPVSGRRHNDLQNIIGMFVNILAIRSQVDGSRTFKKFLEKVKENVLDSYENQDYQYDELIKALGLQGDTTRNPLFDVVLHMFDPDIPREEKNDEQMVKFVPYEDGNIIGIPFDFILNAIEREKQIHLEIRYAAALYKKKRIQMMGRHFQEIIVKVLEDKNIVLKNLLLSHRLTTVKTMTPLEEEGDFFFQV
jgi:tyrocidine synthetase-3